AGRGRAGGPGGRGRGGLAARRAVAAEVPDVPLPPRRAGPRADHRPVAVAHPPAFPSAYLPAPERRHPRPLRRSLRPAGRATDRLPEGPGMSSFEAHFQHRQSAHCESGVMASLLSHAGLPMSEPMAFGLASGLAFAYLPIVKLGGMPL